MVHSQWCGHGGEADYSWTLFQENDGTIYLVSRELLRELPDWPQSERLGLLENSREYHARGDKIAWTTSEKARDGMHFPTKEAEPYEIIGTGLKRR